MTSTTAPLVLISPAMAIGSAYYRPLIEEFEARGWEAKALPRRGFERGLPAASRLHDWNYADEIAELSAGVAQARAAQPERPVLFLGHSLGGQIVAGHELSCPPVDGIITVGAAIPHPSHYPLRGLGIRIMATVVVPVTTTLFGHLPKPFFGAPGARTLMREWSRMVRTGEPPFPADEPIRTPALIVSLEGDSLAPASSVDRFSRRLFHPEAITRWHYLHDEVTEGASNDHITWVRGSAPVAERAVAWWETRQEEAGSTSSVTTPGSQPGEDLQGASENR